MNKIKVIFMRHGESEWNQSNQFTGWQDVLLSKKGIQEAQIAGKLLKKNGFFFDYAYTSMLSRAIYTLWYILKILKETWIPIKKSWQLNERHYGALEGLNKKKIRSIYSKEQIQLWRRSFLHTPPALDIKDTRYPGYDRRYITLNKNELPVSESLENTYNRVIPYWKNVILPTIKDKKKIIVVAHGNSLRALIKYLNNINNDNIINLNISTGAPIVYEFSDTLCPLNYYYLK
ncbi:phosphoglycerate mutase [Buchnera aphidicola (Cinara tujafilina)]|uniref:2,3-bisphosphoglycerate-dependent phosphoglycerate mutase n=1 Tax=Buchnera aphidicola (Cinara tujafilina) TaxID=261317 RepID=F7WZC0_9GAMM|nr:2,3-diphosphoglycerate-dependent phosphoglycerate mutase [Buchnera aphidicola]AEH39781.1 phosphoglycerate mutase [Buchnera aphidicola (Cinara tujafilina)]